MTRQLLASLAATTMSAIIGMTATPAMAQHHHGGGNYGGGYQGGGHYDYHPGHYDRHNGHWDYHPGHYDWHDPHHDGWDHVQPSYVRPSRPTYVSPPRTAYFGETNHPHDHVTRRITYGGFSHIDDLAIELEERMNTLCLELHYNYQHNPGFNETYREAYEMLTMAEYIHGQEHAGNREEIRRAVLDLDGLFHHVESDVAHWTSHHHRRIGHGGLMTKLGDVERTLHHLMEDVGAQPGGLNSGATEPLMDGDSFVQLEDLRPEAVDQIMEDLNAQPEPFSPGALDLLKDHNEGTRSLDFNSEPIILGEGML